MVKKLSLLEHQPWNLSYQMEQQSRPSWSRHGMPDLFEEFIKLVKKSNQKNNLHLDIGCGNGVKTVNFALSGLKTLGVDISNDGFKEARELVKELNLQKKCKFVNANCLDLPLNNKSINSASDILCFTHLKFKDQKKYLREVQRVLKEKGYLLLVLFSNKDEHFHGHKVSKKYTFRFNPNNSLMDGFSHYHGMINIHFDKKDIRKTFQDYFKIIKAVEVKHPLYSHRFLWNVILQKS